MHTISYILTTKNIPFGVLTNVRQKPLTIVFFYGIIIWKSVKLNSEISEGQLYRVL